MLNKHETNVEVVIKRRQMLVTCPGREKKDEYFLLLVELVNEELPLLHRSLPLQAQVLVTPGLQVPGHITF